MTTPTRPITRILAELAEVRRHLGEMPPHHGGGRAALERRVHQLEAELAHARRHPGADRRGPPGPAPRSARD